MRRQSPASAGKEGNLMQYMLIIFGVLILVCAWTGEMTYIWVVGYGLVLLVSALMIIGFAWSLVLLLRSERRSAFFVRWDLPDPESSYRVAYYLVEGTEHPCIFPEEGVLRKKLYRADRACRVRLHIKRGIVFDRYTIITTVVGLIGGLVLGSVSLLTLLV